MADRQTAGPRRYRRLACTGRYGDRCPATGPHRLGTADGPKTYCRTMTPIASIRVVACRETLVAAMLTRLAGMEPIAGTDPGRLVADHGRSGDAVTVAEWTSLPRYAQMLSVEHIPSLHDEVRQMAWASGAWDLTITRHIPDTDSALLFAHADWSACPTAERDALARAAISGSLIDWLWRPMREGPAVRRAKWGQRDSTLDEHGGRSGTPPAPKRPAIWTPPLHRPLQLTARLGITPPRATRRAPKSPPNAATERQLC